MTTPATHERARHWDDRYQQAGAKHVSWFQTRPTMSLQLIDAIGVDTSTAVIDVGGGSSPLVGELVARGFDDITVLDVSRTALDIARRGLDKPHGVTWLHADLLSWTPTRHWGLWHDRAVFHFLTAPADRATYLRHLAASLTANGAFIIATFAPDGPDHCSGLPVSRYDAQTLTDTITTAVPTATISASHDETHTTPSGMNQPFTWIVGTITAG